MNLPYPALMDGDLSILLTKQGLPPQGVCAEQYLLEHPQILMELASQYAKAGSRIVCTPTDAADRSHLELYGLEDKTLEINVGLTQLTVKAAKSQNKEILVAGSLSPLTLHAQPFGETPFLDIVNIYNGEVALSQLWVCKHLQEFSFHINNCLTLLGSFILGSSNLCSLVCQQFI